MKEIKKIICMLLVIAMALACFAGCGKGADEGVDTPASEPTVSNANEVLLSLIKDSPLSEDEMLAAVRNWYLVFDDIFEATGENIHTEMSIDDTGTVIIRTLSPAMDEEGNRTGELQDNGVLDTYDSIRLAFANLVAQKQLDLDGNLMFDPEALIEQAVAAMQPSDEDDDYFIDGSVFSEDVSAGLDDESVDMQPVDGARAVVDEMETAGVADAVEADAEAAPEL